VDQLRRAHSTYPAASGVFALMLVAIIAACGTVAATAAPAVVTRPPDPATPSVEHQLALLDGDPASEDEFWRIVNILQAGTATCAADPSRPHIRDFLESGWQASGKRDTLLNWARAVLAGCGATSGQLPVALRDSGPATRNSRRSASAMVVAWPKG